MVKRAGRKVKINVNVVHLFAGSGRWVRLTAMDITRHGVGHAQSETGSMTAGR